VELKAKTRIAQSKSEGFKKCPDIPLGMVLDRKNAKKNSK
jgi:hypothetical protein